MRPAVAGFLGWDTPAVAGFSGWGRTAAAGYLGGLDGAFGFGMRPILDGFACLISL
jgi:hypothetical protein